MKKYLRIYLIFISLVSSQSFSQGCTIIVKDSVFGDSIAFSLVHKINSKSISLTTNKETKLIVNAANYSDSKDDVFQFNFVSKLDKKLYAKQLQLDNVDIKTDIDRAYGEYSLKELCKDENGENMLTAPDLKRGMKTR